MPRTGDNIYRRKDGRWEGRFSKGQKGSRTMFGYVFGQTYIETRQKLAQARNQWQDGIDATRLGRTKLGSVSARWLKESCAFLKESTIAKYRDYIRCYIQPVFGDTDMADIGNEDVSAFCSSLLKSGGSKGQGLSTKIVQEIFRVMKHLRRYAMTQQYAVGYSADCVSIRQKSRPLRVLSACEQEILQGYLLKNPSRSHLGILVSLSTGLRLGEICALSCDDISLRAQELHVRKTLQRISSQDDGEARTKLVVTPPKSDASVRTIPLPQNLCAILARALRSDGYFLTGNPERFLEPRTMQNRFKSAIAACGIPDANFHALRHTFATRWVEAGLDVKCLSELLGHASVNVTLNRYVHPSMQAKRENMEKLASLRL